jgi:hypothetical protein
MLGGLCAGVMLAREVGWTRLGSGVVGMSGGQQEGKKGKQHAVM